MFWIGYSNLYLIPIDWKGKIRNYFGQLAEILEEHLNGGRELGVQELLAV